MILFSNYILDANLILHARFYFHIIFPVFFLFISVNKSKVRFCVDDCRPYLIDSYGPAQKYSQVDII